MKEEVWKKMVREQSRSESLTTKKGEPIVIIGPAVVSKCPTEKLKKDVQRLYDNPNTHPGEYRNALFKQQRDIRVIHTDTIGSKK